MSEQNEKSKDKPERILPSLGPEPSEPIEIETKGVFDRELLDSAGYPLPPADDPFPDSPMKMLAGMMGDLKDMALNRSPVVFMPPPSEHKVKIFRFNNRTVLAEVEAEIEEYLNNGYRCHMPAVCGDFLIMDFSRIIQTEENERHERQINNGGSDKENGI